MGNRPHRRRAAILAAAAALGALAPHMASGEEPLRGRPFAPVVEGVVQGDLVFAGSSNLTRAGGGQRAAVSAADVDGESTTMCIGRDSGGRPVRPLFRICADNSSSALLDVPAGARVIAARLYVQTSLGRTVGALRAKLDGPGGGFSYRPLPATPGARVDGPAKLYEAVAGAGTVLRQAVWDVTSYVAAAGPGIYTVADIVSERAGPWPPFASWAIVAAYELDPSAGPPADSSRFALRFVSWHDGFEHLVRSSLDIPIRGVDLGGATFGKSLHVVARGQRGRSDNVLFANEPLGNNNAPGDAPPPAGVQLGTDPSCNTVTDVQNDTICVLGTSLSPGAGVDMDVIRIPDRYLRAAGGEAVLQVRATGRDTLAPGVIAVAVDMPGVQS
jgi:hypothetical protein